MRRHRKTAKVRTAQQRARARVATAECRARQRRNLAVFLVAVDGVTLDVLVRDRYLAEAELFDRRAVNRALSRFLWDRTHSQKLSVI